ncbi:MAG: hypothetical protein P8014_19995 [Acidihalobacter sp.]|uniref:hypothetical protein n=1 Tax=Acidihalobacter sp. TaxID=1872108 RepID=UPI00307E7052
MKKIHFVVPYVMIVDVGLYAVGVERAGAPGKTDEVALRDDAYSSQGTSLGHFPLDAELSGVFRLGQSMRIIRFDTTGGFDLSRPDGRLGGFHHQPAGQSLQRGEWPQHDA